VGGFRLGGISSLLATGYQRVEGYVLEFKVFLSRLETVIRPFGSEHALISIQFDRWVGTGWEG
jgi:hypothetical protein